MKRILTTPALASLALLCSALVPTSSLGATYVVNPEGTGDFPTIQIAIFSSANGDVIELTDGVFTGTGNRDILFAGHQVTVRSQNGRPEDCVLDCEGTSTDWHGGFRFLAGESSLSAIEGVTITRAYASGDIYPENSGAAVLCKNGSSPALRNCVFSYCESRTGRGGAIYAENGSAPLIEDCTFYGNSSSYDGGAISFWIDAPGTLLRCHFEANRSARGGAVSCVYSSPVFESCTFVDNTANYDGAVLFADYYCVPVLERCTLYGNTAIEEGGAISSSRYSDPQLISSIIAFGVRGGSVACFWDGLMTAECSDIYGNVGGDWIGCIAGQQGTAGNFSADPLFCDPVHGDLHLDVDSPCALPSATCGQVGAWDVGCNLPPILQVNAEGTGDHPTIQAAIDAAEEGWIVQLEDGSYTGPGNRDLDFGGKSLTLRSRAQDPENCFLECGGSVSTPHRGIYLHSGEGDGTLIEGIWIWDGWTPDEGGGVRCENGVSVEFRNCAFDSNYSELGGGGVACEDANLRFVDCRFLTNQTAAEGGGLLARRSTLSLEHCVFTDNSALRAGGLFLDDVTSTVSRSILDGNEATADGGGFVCDGASAVGIQGSTFYGNTAASGGGISAGGTSNVQISESILSFGSGGAAQCSESAALDAECCDVFGNAGGDWVDCLAGLEGVQGNFSGNPYFCAPNPGRFTIHPLSPCLPENNECGVLIGAEGVGGPNCPGPDPSDLDLPVSGVEQTFRLIGPWPNPGRGLLNFQLGLSRPSQVWAALYDVGGARVATLVDRNLESGEYAFSWDSGKVRERPLASGVYYLRVVADGRTEVRSISIVR